MREILFKAKRLDNGEWVEGYYSFVEKMLCEENVHVIFPYNSGVYQWEKVDPETVCQFTGMTDFSDKKVFEGDILKVCDEAIGECQFVVRFGNCGGVKNTTRLVGYYGFFFEGYDEKAKDYIKFGLRDDPVFWMTGAICEVIGNIHDKEGQA